MTRQDAGQGALRGRRWPWREALVWLGVAGAALLTYAQRVPWARIQATLTQPGQGAPSTSWDSVRVSEAAYSLLRPFFGLGPSSWSDGILFLWYISLPSGFVLALALAIWRQSRLAAYTYMVWPPVATAGIAALVYAIFGRAPEELCQINCAYLAWGARTPAIGLWIALSGLALIWVGGAARLVSLRRAGSRARRIVVLPALRSLLSPAQIGALVVTVGIAVWFFGYFFTPWATQGCTGFPVNWSHFVSGSCAGLDSDEVLVYATASGFGSGSLLGAGVFYVPLGMLAALIAIWQRGWIPPVISLIWVASATWLTALAMSGIPGMLKHPQHFNFSTAPWVVGYGPAVAVTGVVIVWVGVVALWWAWVAGWRNGSRRLSERESAPAV